MFVYPISIHLNSLCQALFNYPLPPSLSPSFPPSLPPSPKHFAQTLIMYLKSSTEQDTSFPQTGESSHEDSLGTSSGNNFYTPRSVTPVTCQILDTSDPPSESRVEVKIFSLYLYNALFFLFTCKQGDQSQIYRRGGRGGWRILEGWLGFRGNGGKGVRWLQTDYKGGLDAYAISSPPPPLPQTVRQVSGKKYIGYEEKNLENCGIAASNFPPSSAPVPPFRLR